MKKKILFIHTTYRSVGGEDIAVEKEYEFLSKEYEIRRIYISNNSKNILNDLFIFLFNRNYLMSLKLNKIISEYNPDLAYVHNTWYKGSLSIFYTLSSLKIPFVIKLHNFRYFCTRSFSSKSHLMEKPYCPACGYSKIKIFNKYFINSFLKSFMVNRYGRKYIKILKDNTQQILVLTDFHQNFLSNLGVDKEKISVFPNYLYSQRPIYKNNLDKYFIYAGRVSEEKGVEQLINSFKNCNFQDIKLMIVGSGPNYNEYLEKYNSDNILFLNQLNNEETLKLISKSQGVVTATKLYEGQPTLLCEASLLGIPSIFPISGGIAEFFPSDYKYSFEQFNYDDLEFKLKKLASENLEQIGMSNYEFITKYLSKNKLLSLFNKILEFDI